LDVSKKPAVRGLVFCDSVSVGVIGSRSGCFGAFVSSRKIAFPGNRDFGSQRLGSNARLLSEKAKHQVLLRPFCGQVGEARHAHSMWKPPLDGGPDEIGCQVANATEFCNTFRGKPEVPGARSV
jgi:hypothetical protein